MKSNVSKSTDLGDLYYEFNFVMRFLQEKVIGWELGDLVNIS